MDQAITDFINCRHIAVVGVSRNSRKYGSMACRTLKSRGYEVYPVHPELEEFEGMKCRSSLRDVPDQVEAALIAVSPAAAGAVVDDAADRGIRRVWFPLMADFSSAAGRAQDKGMEVVSKKCILMYAPPVTGIHGVHRFVARLFGRL